MTNYLKMHKKQQVIALLELGWSYRRIEAETGVRRETVSGYDRGRRSNPAKVFPGSEDAEPTAAVLPRPRSVAARNHDVVEEKLKSGLTAQRIWQDLVEDGYPHSYESVKRFHPSD